MLIRNRFGKDHLFTQAEGGYLSNPLRACPGPGVLLVVLAACHMEIPETVQDLLAKPGDFLVGYSLTERPESSASALQLTRVRTTINSYNFKRPSQPHKASGGPYNNASSSPSPPGPGGRHNPYRG